jgi:predicted SAM-dependent methyltransferase
VIDSAHPGIGHEPARLLNFGCGGNFHSGWVNLDTLPATPEVISYDLGRQFPFPDESFDAVYGSHVLEHFDPEIAKILFADCYRILKPGGIVRIVVPDLESIARLYLSSLEGAVDGRPESESHYDWMMLELYDQSVRKTSGGKMAAYLAQGAGRAASAFVASRVGCEGSPELMAVSRTLPIGFRLRRKLRLAFDSVRQVSARAFAFAFLGSQGSAALREGLFRVQGEVHQWMYDRFSLERILRQSGFVSIRKRAAADSDIDGFSGHQLEIVDGRERKPDSLYMEGRKPERA